MRCILILSFFIFNFTSPTWADEQPSVSVNAQIILPDQASTIEKTVMSKPVDISNPDNEYTIGIDDILDINILQPEQMANEVTVAPDGRITLPYIGSVLVKGKTIAKVQEEVQERLANGYMKYPVVAASLKQSLSRKFFVYGEVEKPGPYYLEENTTVLQAISEAGGFTRFGSSSNVKILHLKKGSIGYETIKVNIKAIMDGDSNADTVLSSGDIVVVSEGIF